MILIAAIFEWATSNAVCLITDINTEIE